MSKENVDVVRRMNEAFDRVAKGDFGALEEALAQLDPAIVWYGTVGGVDEQRVARGYEELMRAFADNFGTWESLTLETEDYIDAGGDHVVVLWHEIARSRHSQEEMETRTGVVYRLRDGKVVEARGYMNRDDALEAAGLSSG